MSSKQILLSADHVRQLVRIGVCAGALTPLLLICTMLLSSIVEMDIYLTNQVAGVITMLMLQAVVISPLILKQPKDNKYKGFLVFWFCLALTFNLVWQIPLDVFSGILVDTPVTRENTWWAIFWWSYTLSDLDYLNIFPYVLAIELWWLGGNLIGAYGLYLIYKGRDSLAYICLGVSGAFQAYNASLYMLTNGIDGAFHNVSESPAALAEGGSTFLAWVLYWGFNGFWCLAGAVSAIVAFQLLLKSTSS